MPMICRPRRDQQSIYNLYLHVSYLIYCNNRTDSSDSLLLPRHNILPKSTNEHGQNPHHWQLRRHRSGKPSSSSSFQPHVKHDRSHIFQAAAQLLIKQGNTVYLHARNTTRATEASKACPGAAGVLTGDLTSLSSTKDLASQANAAGPWDAVIHNAGLGPSNTLGKTADGFPSTFQVNSLAPYVLTALMTKPKRLLYLSSSLHSGGSDSLKDLAAEKSSSMSAYSDSKLHDVMLANAVARYWPDVQSCSLDPGWIATKMGGSGAPGKTSTPAKAIAEFAEGSSGVFGERTGVYGNPQGARTPHTGALDEAKQDEFMRLCGEFSGVEFPR